MARASLESANGGRQTTTRGGKWGTDMSTAFVLASGGSLAAAQVGMLRALFEAGIEPDLIVGSSAGAINAVAFAQNPTPAGLDRLERLWSGLRRATVFPINAWDVIAGLAGRRD